jgi:hypothetical protein
MPMIRSCHLAAVVVALSLSWAGSGTAHAQIKLIARLAIEPLSLKPPKDMPFIEGRLNEAVTAYNTAADAYNEAHGYAPGSAMAAAPVDRSALELHTTLVTLAPGIEIGAFLPFMKLRAEALFSMSDHHRAIGVGFYPIDFALPLPVVTPYVVAGATLRLLNRSDTDGESGGFGNIRIAAGARYGHLMVELGLGVWQLGGMYNGDELRSIASNYDPRGSAPPPPPDRVVSGGTQTGMIDFSIGITLP